MSAANIVARFPLIGNSPNAQAFMNENLTPPIAPRETLIAAVIDGFNALAIAGTVWLSAGAEQGIAFTNLFGDSPRLTWPVGFGAFTVDRGPTPMGSSAFIETNFNPSTDTNFTRNSGCFFIWLLNGSVTGGVMTNSNGTAISIQLDFGGGHIKWKLNDGSSTSGDDAGVIAYADGLYVLNRTGASAKTLDFNGTQIDSKTTASEAIPSATIQCAANNVLTIGAMGFLPGLSSGQRTAIYSTILQPYMHGIGAA